MRRKLIFRSTSHADDAGNIANSPLADTYPELSATLAPEQARRVDAAVANGVLDGWEPTREDIELQVRVALGEITSTDVINQY